MTVAAQRRGQALPNRTHANIEAYNSKTYDNGQPLKKSRAYPQRINKNATYSSKA